MKLNWGFSTLGCPELSLWEVLELANEFAFQSLELRFLDGVNDLNHSLDLFLGIPGSIQKVMDSGVEIRGIDTSFALTSSSPEAMEELKRSALHASKLKARYLRVFDGAEFGERPTGAQRKIARANFREWECWRSDLGLEVELTLETHGATASSERVLELFDAIGDEMAVIWDTHHTMILAGERPEDTWERLRGYIVGVHVKDSSAVPSARHPYTYVLPGRGRVPVREVLRLLESHFFEGVVILEWEKKWHSYLSPLRDAMEAMFAAGWR